MQQFFCRMLAYVQCHHEVELNIDEIECLYEAETQDEENQLANEIHGLAVWKHRKIASLFHTIS